MEGAVNDKDGLDRAYASANKTFVAGDTLYVAGTSNLRDVMDDTLIPLGQTRHSQRYGQAERTLKAMPQVRRVIGHSLGGAVALQLAKDHGLESRTFGAPVLSFSGGERYRNYGDPISTTDFGAHTSYAPRLNPHSYANLATKPINYTPTAGDGWYIKGGATNAWF